MFKLLCVPRVDDHRNSRADVTPRTKRFLFPVHGQNFIAERKLESGEYERNAKFLNDNQK